MQRVFEFHWRPTHKGLGLRFRVSGGRSQTSVAQIQGEGVTWSSSLWNCKHGFVPERYSGQRRKKGLGCTKISSRALGLRSEATMGVAMSVGGLLVSGGVAVGLG
jgi:hypothetical protein